MRGSQAQPTMMFGQGTRWECKMEVGVDKGLMTNGRISEGEDELVDVAYDTTRGNGVITQVLARRPVHVS